MVVLQRNRAGSLAPVVSINSRQALASPYDDDTRLVAGLHESNPAAMDAFVERYADYVERVLARILGIDAELPDLVNDVFVNALGSLHTLRVANLLRPWLRSVTVFVARGCLRRRRRRRWLTFLRDEELPEVPSYDAPASATTALKRLYSVLGTLPPDERIVFALRFIDEMELGEIADACGVSRTTIKRRVRKAEDLFTREARKDPLLSEWMAKGDRWNES